MYAFGFRNPWRFSFDRANGDMWIGDVGQDLWEEVDRIPAGTAAGENFGWSYYEGTHLYNGGNGNPKPTTRVVFPLAQFPHMPATGPANCSVTGGYVYRGARPAFDPRLLPVRGLLLRADLATAGHRRSPVRDGDLTQGDQHQLVRPGLWRRPLRDLAERLDLPDRDVARRTALVQRRRLLLDSVDQAAGANVGSDRLDLGRERPVTVEMR